MNKKSLLVVGLLFSLSSVLADPFQSKTLISQSLQDLYNEADRVQAQAIADAVVSGNQDMTTLFEGIPAAQKDLIYGYVIEAMSEMEKATEDRDALINAVERRAYFQNKKSSITGPGEPTRIEQAKAFAYDNQQSIAVGVSAFILSCWLNSGSNPTVTIEEIRAVIQAEVPNQAASEAIRNELIEACKTYVVQGD